MQYTKEIKESLTIMPFIDMVVNEAEVEAYILQYVQGIKESPTIMPYIDMVVDEAPQFVNQKGMTIK